jgi:hypothetical protein
VSRQLAALCAPVLLAAAGALAEAEAPGVPAAPPEAAPSAPATEWIRPEEVPAWADALLRQLEAVRPAPAALAALARAESGLAELAPALDVLLAGAQAALAGPSSLAELEDLRGGLEGTARSLREWQEELELEAKRLGRVTDEIARAERLWSETLPRPETREAGETVERRIRSSLEALRAASTDLRAWRGRLLDLSDRLLDRDSAVVSALEKVREKSLAQRASLLVPDGPPLWRRGLADDLGRELPLAPALLRDYQARTRDYIASDARPFVAQALLAVLLGFALRRTAARTRERLASEPALARAARVLERPYATALLLALLASPFLHALAPRRLVQLMALVALLPAVRVVRHVSERARLRPILGLCALLVLDRLVLALAPLPALSGAIFLVGLAVAAAVALGFARRPRGAPEARWIPRAARLALVGQLAILVGGLGVGVGLGLQDLVRNFAAGLTLLFERRVDVGDALQIPKEDVHGRVIAIGTRATVIRSWDGAEVVVPNADLISAAVSNWTLSDRLRCIEIPVVVAPGAEPERVLKLLLDVARSEERLRQEPAPQALFKGFGERSLDFALRAWTEEEYERTLTLASDLALAAHRRLDESGVPRLGREAS